MNTIFDSFTAKISCLSEEESESFVEYVTARGACTIADYIDYLIMLGDDHSLEVASKLRDENNAFKVYLSQTFVQN